MPRVDYTTTAAAFRRARTLPPAVLARWTDAAATLDLGPVDRVLDLGAGPGGFLDSLVEWFGAPALALEPSAGMRAEAADTGATARHPYAAAVAERLPVRSGSVDVAWLSTVIHQFDDLDAAARELRRVVRSGGRVLIRGYFSDLTVTGILTSFPGIERAARTFPSTADTAACFERAGFTRAAIVDVVEPWRFELAAWVERVQSIRHTDSALRPLTDDEFAEGVRRVRVEHEHDAGPIDNDITIRLLVLAD
jgi:SAM-dependent methyltransferase